MADDIELAAALLGLERFHVLAVSEAPDELTVVVETTAERAFCPECGSRAEAHERMPVELRDLPCFGRPVRLAWHGNHCVPPRPGPRSRRRHRRGCCSQPGRGWRWRVRWASRHSRWTRWRKGTGSPGGRGGHPRSSPVAPSRSESLYPEDALIHAWLVLYNVPSTPWTVFSCAATNGRLPNVTYGASAMSSFWILIMSAFCWA